MAIMPLVKEVLFLLLLVRVHAQTTSYTNGSSLSNMSFPLFSTTPAPYFPYIIPFGQTQECDIYGLVCQTGSITVGIDLTTTTMTTVLPCSSYLTAQSNYIVGAGQFQNDGQAMQWQGVGSTGIVGTWAASFGRSPECTSFAQAFSNSLYTFSDCGSSNTIFSTQEFWNWGDSFGYPPQIPPGLVRYYDEADYASTCCGACTLDFSEMRLYYFPDGNATDCQYNGTSNSTSAFTAGNLGKRMQSLIPDGSTAVVGEHTFTSPSLYLQVVGTAGVNDECTDLGPVLTSPIMTLAPGELSTWIPSSEYMSYFPTGQAVSDGAEGEAISVYGEIKPLLIKDLACPTWGVGMSTSADGTLVATVGSPFLPLIIPPAQAFTLDPTWSALCTGLMTDVLQSGNFMIFDPPTVLAPASNMVRPPKTTPAVAQASPTTAPESQPTASAVPVKPASPLTNHEAPPAETGDPVVGSKVSTTGPGPEEPSPLVSDPDGPAQSASDSVDPHVNTAPVLPATPASSAINAGNPPIDPAASSLASLDPSPGGPSDPISVPNAPEQAATHVGESSEPHTQDLGAIIHNAIGGSGPQGSGQRSERASETNIITLPASSSQLITTIESHVLSMNPSDLAFEGITYSPKGPAMTLSSNVFTLVPYSDSDDKRASDGSNGQASDLLMVSTPLVIGGHTLVPNPSGIVIDGHPIQPGSSALTIFNTPISLGGSEILAFGSSGILLPSQSIFVIGSQTFTVNPTGFPRDAGSISPDGPVETIDGTAITLGLSDILAMGTSKFSLPDNRAFTVAGQLITPNPSAFPIAGTAISAGGPAVTVDGTTVSLDSSGVLAIGSSTFTLPTPTPAASVNSPLVIAGQAITPSGSAFSVAGTTLSPGGPAVTINGTIVSLQPSGTLIIGSNSFALPTPLMSSYDIGGFSVQAESSFAVVDGVTVDPGAVGVTVGGSAVSLEFGGKTLDVGSGRFAMPTESVNGTVGLQTFHGGQGKEWTLSVHNFLGAWIFVVVMLR